MFHAYRPWLRRFTIAVIAPLTAFLGSALAFAEQEMGIVPPQERAGFSSERLAVGDRVKIAFFEHVDFAESEGSTGPASKSFYQRMDLSGEYTVDPNGSLSLPRLGSFDVAGQSTNSLQSMFAETFENQFGRLCDVTISLIGREPIFVVGDVKNAGSYDFVRNMMVLHALALAGGTDMERAGDTLAIEILRERERYAAALLRLKRLLIERARLEAERDDLGTIAVPERLTEIAVGAEISKLLELEAEQLELALSNFASLSARLADQVKVAKRDIEASRERAGKQSELISLRRRRLQDLQGMRQSGDMRSTGVTHAKAELVDAETRLLDLNADLRLREAHLRDKEQEFADLRTERQGRIAAELARNSDEIAATEALIASIDDISGVLAAKGASFKAKGEKTEIEFEIVRAGNRSSPTAMPADELTRLRPGDVLRVRVGPASPAARGKVPDMSGRVSN